MSSGVTGDEELLRLLHHLNSIALRIQLIMEKETCGLLAFLDVLATKNDGGFGHRVYCKPTDTDRYLHKESNLVRQKCAVIRGLSWTGLHMFVNP